MSRQNTVRKGPSARQKEQALLDEELAETGHHEGLDDSASPGVTSILSSPTKSGMGEDSTRPSLFKKAFGLFISRKTPLEHAEAKDLAQAELPNPEGEELPVPDPSALKTQPAAPNPTTLKSPSRTSVSLTKSAKRKRASDAERQDLYEVPTEKSSHNSEPEDPSSNRSAKRTRRNVKAKKPLTLPKTNKGHPSLQDTRQTKGSPPVEAEEAETPPDVRPAGTVNGKRDAAELEQLVPKKTSRGRPPKNKNPDNPTVPVAAITSPKQIGSVEQQETSKTKNRTTINCPLKLSNDEDALYVGENEEEERADDYEEMELEEKEELADLAINQPRRIPFDPKVIEKMWEISKHVGYKFDTTEETWSHREKAERTWTGPGKRMIGQLETLISSYKKLQEAKVSGDKHASRDAHIDAEKALNVLTVEAEVVVTERFGPDLDEKKAKAMLTDLYFKVMPNCFHALKEAVAVYNIQGSMETDGLEEIFKLINMLYDLASAAVTQQKEIQPKPKGRVSYQISQPTRYNLPDIRKVRKEILMELNSREREEERAKQELLRPERERQFFEGQQREEAEIRRKREERHRLQGESWWTVRNNYFPGSWNRILQTDIARLEAARKGKGRQDSVELGYPRMSRAESRRANSEESRQGVERVSVFPANNVKASSSMSSLSKEDTLIFIDCMRYEQGADRYERAAEQICRSMDEVFAFAKEFQEAMDLQHQEGNFTEARDSWTYSVWVEQE